MRRRYRRFPQLVLVRLPIHASWLNQVEIYLSIVQRKVLTPNDFSNLREIPDRLLSFQRRYEAAAKPFRWEFTGNDLANLLGNLDSNADQAPLPCAV